MAKKKKAKKGYGYGPYGAYGPAMGWPGQGGHCPPWMMDPDQAARAWKNAAGGWGPYGPPRNDWTQGWLDFQNPAFVKGLVIGALGATVVGNPAVQKKSLETLAQVWGMLQGGFEEVKERFRDIEAEMQATARAASADDDLDRPGD